MNTKRIIEVFGFKFVVSTAFVGEWREETMVFMLAANGEDRSDVIIERRGANSQRQARIAMHSMKVRELSRRLSQGFFPAYQFVDEIRELKAAAIVEALRAGEIVSLGFGE